MNKVVASVLISFTAIVCDTVNVNTAAVRIGGWLRWSCFAHVIQLAIIDGISLPEVKTAIDSVRAIASHFRKSVVATSALLNAQRVRGEYSCGGWVLLV